MITLKKVLRKLLRRRFQSQDQKVIWQAKVKDQNKLVQERKVLKDQAEEEAQ